MTHASLALNHSVNQHAVAATPFFVSDWENELDLMVEPTRDQLVAHLRNVPPDEANSDMATYLRNMLGM